MSTLENSSDVYREICSLASTNSGKYLLGIKEEGRVIKTTHNSIHILKDIQGDKAVVKAYFWIDSKVLNTFAPLITQLEIAHEYKLITNKEEAFLHYSGIHPRFQKYPSIHLLTYQQTPLAGGGRDYTNLSGTWATVRAQGSSDNTDGAFTIESEKSGVDFQIFRTFCPFDTSSLTNGATISAGTLDFYRSDAFNTFANADSTTLEIIVTTQASVTSLALSDYSLVTFSSKGSLAFSATSDTTYNSITISDLTIINKTSNTKLGVITGRDLADSAPTGNNSIGSSTAPRLTLTYLSSAGNLLASEI